MRAPILIMMGLFAAGCGDEVTESTSGAGGSGGETSSSSTTGGNASTGTAGGDSSTGGGQQTMGATQACQDCVSDVYGNDPDCAANIQTCDDDPACNAYKNCTESCFNENDTPSCYAGCEEQFPHDLGLSTPLESCTCDACDAVCVAACS